MTGRPLRPLALAALRSHTLSKAFAVFFITLILLPFTAPFPTFDLTGATSTHALDCSDKIKTAADDLAVMTAPVVEPSRWLIAGEAAPVVLDRVVPLARPLRAVLRL